MAVTANFNKAAKLLTAFGDDQADTIVFSRDAAGMILVNGGAVPIAGGPATVANTGLMQVFGQAGNDVLTVDESNGAMPAVEMFGGAGNDVLTGGSGNDLLFGQAGNDTLLGKGGDDLLFGGDGNDVLIGGAGDDQVFGQAGDDRMIWNPGDGTDLFEGGDGTDTAEVNGGNGSETFSITANGSRVRFDRLDPAPFSLDIGTTENLVLNANGGDDVITAGNGLAGLINLTLDGGAGNDTITGGDGNDVLIGGDGNDVVIGGRGNDVAFLGSGDDTFVWNPGDGSDTVEGQGGTDTLQFNGANVSEHIDISANGDRVRFFRDVGNVTMDVHSVEHIAFTARGGADNITVNDLSGTGVKQVAIDLSGTPGSGTGDGQSDTVTINGRAGNDQITVTGSGSSVDVTGLPAEVTITGSEGGLDSLVINSGDGNDKIDASTLPAGVISLIVNAGNGNNTVIGSAGADLLVSGDGNDVITGGRGNDVALMGAGDDKFIWNPGDGSDIVEGQGGTDTLQFNGANIAENIDISANGSRVLFLRDVANITMDLNGVEHIRFAALGGADRVAVHDLSGTGVTQVAVDLAAAATTSGDGQPDQVSVDGTAGDDTIQIARNGSTITVDGLAAQVTVAHTDGTLDTLVVNGQGGNDTINASALSAGHINLVLNGGDGNDLIVGSEGNDTVVGGRGDDVALMGKGDDTFVWNPGDGSDTIEGQSGTDTLLFNGANVSEHIDISANGGRVLFQRDVANITMDVHGVEHIQFNALGGADTVTVNDLSGTDVNQVGIDLGAPSGSGQGDGQVDTVVVNATAGDDVISISAANGVVTVSGLTETVTITGFEATDRLVINGLGGDDVIDASQLGGAMQLTANGGDGNDVLIGSSGNDVLTGGAGDDVLLGQGGSDVLDGGPGNNIVISGNPSFVGQIGAQAATMQFIQQGGGPGTPQLGLAADQHAALTGGVAGTPAFPLGMHTADLTRPASAAGFDPLDTTAPHLGGSAIAGLDVHAPVAGMLALHQLAG